jgi:putative nucleotidyltransferase with HDIG domain
MTQTAQAPQSKTIDRIVSTIGELPASPSIVNAVINLTNDLNSDVSQLAKHLASDQVLTAKVLKLSNSSFYGRAKTVSNVNDAIVILGFHTIRSLVLASSVRNLYKSKKPDEFEEVLWEHSLSTAIICRMIAQHLRHSQKDIAFIAGILHDIGKLILYRKYPKKYDRIIKFAKQCHTNIHKLETESIGVNHMEVGAALLAKWNFPDEYVDAIRDHHDWKEPENMKEIPVSWMVNYSSICSSLIGCDIANHPEYEAEWVEAAAKLDIPLEKAQELNNNLFDVFNEEKKIYG